MLLNKFVRVTPFSQCLRGIVPVKQLKPIFTPHDKTMKRFFGIDIPEGPKIPQGTKFTDTHEWLLSDKGIVTIGITNYAQLQLGDLVYAELSEKGRSLKKGEVLCLLESVKAASEVYVPCSGEIVDVNTELESKPELINKSPYGDGWIAKMRIEDDYNVEKMMDEKQYDEFLEKN